jgi:hypothetical protein
MKGSIMCVHSNILSLFLSLFHIRELQTGYSPALNFEISFSFEVRNLLARNCSLRKRRAFGRIGRGVVSALRPGHDSLRLS